MQNVRVNEFCFPTCVLLPCLSLQFLFLLSQNILRMVKSAIVLGATHWHVKQFIISICLWSTKTNRKVSEAVRYTFGHYFHIFIDQNEYWNNLETRFFCATLTYKYVCVFFINLHSLLIINVLWSILQNMRSAT